jgi:hypothetical protein
VPVTGGDEDGPVSGDLLVEGHPVLVRPHDDTGAALLDTDKLVVLLVPFQAYFTRAGWT